MPPTKYPGVEVRNGPQGEVYRARVRHGQRAGGGVISRTFSTLPAALAWRAEVIAAVRDGGELPAPPPPLAPLVVTRLATVEDAARTLSRGMRAGTVRTRSGSPFKPSVTRKYESMGRVYVIPELGSIPLVALTKRDVQRFVDALAAKKSAETARKALTALRVAIRVAEGDGLLDVNPCAGVRVPVDPDGERPVRVLTPEECEAIVEAAEAEDSRLERSLAGPLVALAFATGLRSGELLALAWGPDGLDLDAGMVRVRRSLDRDRGADGAFAITAPKSRASVRDVPLPPEDTKRLRRHRLATGRPRDGALVFSDAQGRPLYAKGIVRHTWRAAVEGSGIAAPLPRLHDTRHAWAIAALRAGVRPEALAALGGWSDVGMVHKRYGRHALPEELAGAGLAIERFRKNRRTAAAQARPK